MCCMNAVCIVMRAVIFEYREVKEKERIWIGRKVSVTTGAAHSGEGKDK